MIGLVLAATSTLLQEIGWSIGKVQVRDHKESIYTMGVLDLIFGTLIFLFIALFIKRAFLLSFASLPTLITRAVLEVAQAHASMLAIAKADRSSFGFIRIGTIPLLLSADVLLGYTIGFLQILGIATIVLALIILWANHGIRKNGIGYVIFITVNAAATISLFKYNITNFNSVEAEQSVIMLILTAYFLIMALLVAKENPVQFFKNPIFLAQAAASGLGHVFISFAYLFAPASVITTAKRSFGILWSILSGNFYFQEKSLLLKLFSFVVITGGLVLLVI